MNFIKEQNLKSDIDLLEVKFNNFLSSLEEFEECYSGNLEFEKSKNSIIKRVFETFGKKLNSFSYDDTYSHCGDYGGSKSTLITYLTKEEVLQKLRDYVVRNPKYCLHQFLNHLSPFGICLENGYPDGSFVNDEQKISIDWAFSKEEIAEQNKKQQELLRLEKEAKNKELEAKQAARELETYQRLKKKFEG